MVVAGLGDTGLLTATHLAGHADVVGISSKPGLVSGQELGLRLSRPEAWTRDYWTPFEAYRRLDGVRTVHGTLAGLDLAARSVDVEHGDGTTSAEPFDVLILATGVTNGFWRQPHLQSADDVAADLRSAHDRLAAASSIAMVGGGAAAMSSALNLATRWPATQVDLYFPGERALPQHHGRVWASVSRRLSEAGVDLHPGHRAVLPDGFACEEITADPVTWSTGQPDAHADAVLWAIGRVRPNTGWLPPTLLDDNGFVAVDPTLQATGHASIWAVGDVAATDPLRSSARNRADKLLAHNIRAALAGKPLRSYRPPLRRWGSVVGTQPDGLEIFAPSGRPFRIPAWANDHVLRPWVVRRGIYGGMRDS